MDAVEFFKTVKRLCKNPGCEGCPVCKDGMCMVMRMVRLDENSVKSIEETISKVEQWAKDHPIKTRQSEFLKIFPETAVRDGVIFLCPKLTCQTLAGTDSISRCERNDCAKCRREYWLAEVTDND